MNCEDASGPPEAADILPPPPASPPPAGWGQGAQWFQTTHWSVVLQANGDGHTAQSALEKLCRDYWYPLYLYVRRDGHDATDAEDLTQGFFEHLLRGDRLRQADQSRGRFRTFLLAALKNFLCDARDHRSRIKRGGRHTFVSWDAEEAEARFAAEAADSASPDVLFDRRWAAVTVERVQQRVREEFHAAGKAALHDALTRHADEDEPTYEEIARQLGTTEAAVKAAAHRLRLRLRERLWEEVAQTVSSPQEMKAELGLILEAAAREGT